MPDSPREQTGRQWGVRPRGAHRRGRLLSGRVPKRRAIAPLLQPVLFALAATACTTAQPPMPPDLAGAYEFSWSRYEGDAPPRGLPLLPLGDVQDNSLVHVSVDANRDLVITFTNAAGEPSVLFWSLADESLTWDDTSLSATVDPPGGVPIFPGLVRERLRTELSRDCQGRLVVQWAYREYGLALFIVPFIDAYSGRGVLAPSLQECGVVPASEPVRAGLPQRTGCVVSWAAR